MIRVDVKPRLLRWARERVGYTPEMLAERFPKLAALFGCEHDAHPLIEVKIWYYLQKTEPTCLS